MKRLAVLLVIGIIAAAFGITAASAADFNAQTEFQGQQGKGQERHLREEGHMRGKRGEQGDQKDMRQHQRKLMKHIIHARVESVDSAKNTITLVGKDRTIVMAAQSVITVVTEDGAKTGTLVDLQKGDFITAVVKRNFATEEKHDMTGYVVIKMPKPEKPAPAAEAPAAQPAQTPAQ